MSSLRILMISHDNNGLSKTARSLNVATHIADKVDDCSILVLTDLSIIGKFRFPQNVDFVHLPGIVYKSNREFRARSLNIHNKKTLKIRRKIAQSTAKTFRPHLVVVEGDPNKLPAEMRRTLYYVREELPKTKIIWSLPDIVGDPERVKSTWEAHLVYKMFKRLVDEVWVYGSKSVFDQTAHYGYPAEIAHKVVHTGYLKCANNGSDRAPKEILSQSLKKPFVLVNAGSGLQSFPLIESYLRFLEKAGDNFECQSMIVTGPMMAKREKELLLQRAAGLENVTIHRFMKSICQYVKHAELVLNTGGYNSLCEILGYNKRAVLVPTIGARLSLIHI